MALTEHICRTGFALGVETVEVLVEPFVARLAGVDGTAGWTTVLRSFCPVVVLPSNVTPSPRVRCLQREGRNPRT